MKNGQKVMVRHWLVAAGRMTTAELGSVLEESDQLPKAGQLMFEYLAVVDRLRDDR